MMMMGTHWVLNGLANFGWNGDQMNSWNLTSLAGPSPGATAVSCRWSLRWLWREICSPPEPQHLTRNRYYQCKPSLVQVKSRFNEAKQSWTWKWTSAEVERGDHHRLHSNLGSMRSGILNLVRIRTKVPIMVRNWPLWSGFFWDDPVMTE